MNLNFKGNFIENAPNLLRRCGYIEIYDRKSGKTSFSRKLRSDHYPRFHVYIGRDEPGSLQINMHLDMKKPSYEGSSAHSGEYDGPLIANEARRVQGILAGLMAGQGKGSAAPDAGMSEPKKSFWENIFGGEPDD